MSSHQDPSSHHKAADGFHDHAGHGGATIKSHTTANMPASDRATGSTAKDVIYTCPMHPQIRLPKPGNCPICGMALEPEVPLWIQARVKNIYTCAAVSGSASC